MKIMAVDFGDVRTGLAVCDRTEFLASPVGVIEEKSFAKAAEKIVYATREFAVEMVVIGLPKNMDGSAAKILAANGTYGKKRKQSIDAVSAVVILEGYMAWRKNTGRSQ